MFTASVFFLNISSSAGDTAINYGVKEMGYTKEQWAAETAEAKANGCAHMVMSFEAWLEYRKLIDSMFNAA